MPFELRLAFKYFRARQKSLARFTSIVAIIGIAAGVAGLITANALARGFADEMRDKILANTAHISVFAATNAEIFDWPQVAERLKSIENVAEITPTSYTNAVIIGESETSYAVLKTSNRKPQSPNSKSVSIGRRLAEKLNLKPGDKAEILTVENQTPTRIEIGEIFETGLFDYDSVWIYVSPELFAYLQKQTFWTPANFSVSVKNIYKADVTAEKIRAELGDIFKVIDWQEANRPLFSALSLERKVALTIISLIIFIAALNITTTLALLVNERRLDIAVLRVCGARTRMLISIFLFEGLFLSFAGIFSGVFLGLGFCALGNYFRLVSIPPDVYALNYIPFHPDFSSILLIAAAALVICLTAIAYPAFKASRIKPLENLRTQ